MTFFQRPCAACGRLLPNEEFIRHPHRCRVCRAHEAELVSTSRPQLAQLSGPGVGNPGVPPSHGWLPAPPRSRSAAPAALRSRACPSCLQIKPPDAFAARTGKCMACKADYMHAKRQKSRYGTSGTPDSRRAEHAAVVAQIAAGVSCACCKRTPKKTPQHVLPRLPNAGPVCWKCKMAFDAYVYLPDDLVHAATWLKSELEKMGPEATLRAQART